MRVPNFSVVCRFQSLVARYAAGALALVLGLHARTVLGQTIDEFGAVHGDIDTNRTTSQDIAVELRFGPYQPGLPNLTGDIPSFGDELGRNNRVLLGIEADWQALRIPKILNVGPGVGMGYTRLSKWGYATSNSIAYSATLKLMPQWLWAVLRVDVLQQRLGVPVVFSAKLGAARASWWSTNQRSGVTQSNSGSAQGLAWALGAMFDLGFIEPARARHLDQTAGINHMYLFWEWYQFKLDDFGKGPNSLGDSTWTLGWALDM
jgi:hypothetical protein